MPLELYERFRDPLRDHQSQAVGDAEAQAQEDPDFDHEAAIHTYQKLITQLPGHNRQLLLYILDLLAVFASKSDANLMTSANLAAIFQPGLLSHPIHDMSPAEYRLSQIVLIFLIDNQDSFLIGMSGTAVDEKTVQEVQNATPPRLPSTPKANQAGLGRSASNASAGADSHRMFSGIRRNVSVSSRGSKHSSNQAPTTPSSGVFATGGSGVYRSNTVPSKKSPALSSTRYARGVDSPNTPVALSPSLVSPSARSTSPAKGSLQVPEVRNPSSSQTSLPTAERSVAQNTASNASNIIGQSREHLLPNDNTATAASSRGSPNLRPTQKGRKVSDILTKSLNAVAGEKDPSRQPNKLKKKQAPGGVHPSAHSSTNSLTAAEESANEGNFRTPMMTPGVGAQAPSGPILESSGAKGDDLVAKQASAASASNVDTQVLSSPPRLGDAQQASETTLRAKSPPRSVHSKSSATDISEQDHLDDGKSEKPEKRSRWRFSHSHKEKPGQLGQSPARVGSNAVAEKSTSSIGSWHKSRKSTSNDAPAEVSEPVPAIPPQHVNTEGSKTSDEYQLSSSEKRSFFGKMKDKIHHAREERKERESEKFRAKSPSRDAEKSGSKQSLSAIANDVVARNRSTDVGREPIPESVIEREGERPNVKDVAE